MGTVTTTTFSSDTETVTRTKLNDLVTNLLNEFNGNIENSNIKSTAAIVNSKINYDSTITLAKTLIGTPDAITATSDGVAASITTLNTEVTTNDDDDLDNVTLANGTSGQVKHIYCVASFAGDSWKITPTTFAEGTQITFGDNSVGAGCTLVYADSEGWIVVGNNGGTIA